MNHFLAIAILILSAARAFADPGESSQSGAAILGGNFLGLVSGAGGEVSRELGTSWQIAASFMTGSGEFRKRLAAGESPTSHVQVKSFRVGGDLALLDARFFPLGSLFVACGVGRRRVSVAYDLESPGTLEGVKSRVEVISLVGHASFGNVWKWPSGLSLGAEWLGWTQPFRSLQSSETETFGFTSRALNELQVEANGLADDVAKTPSPQFAVVSAGYAF